MKPEPLIDVERMKDEVAISQGLNGNNQNVHNMGITNTTVETSVSTTVPGRVVEFA